MNNTLPANGFIMQLDEYDYHILVSQPKIDIQYNQISTNNKIFMDTINDYQR